MVLPVKKWWCSTVQLPDAQNSQLHILPGPCDSQIFRQSLQESLQILGKSRPPSSHDWGSFSFTSSHRDRPTKTRQLTLCWGYLGIVFDWVYTGLSHEIMLGVGFLVQFSDNSLIPGLGSSNKYLGQLLPNGYHLNAWCRSTPIKGIWALSQEWEAYSIPWVRALLSALEMAINCWLIPHSPVSRPTESQGSISQRI